MSYYRGFGLSNYSNNNLFSYSSGHNLNQDGLITASDFREGAYRMGLGSIAPDIVQSAFNTFDRDHKGFLNRNDAFGAYGYLHRLYS